MLNIPIVIAAFNREHTLLRLLPSLVAAHYPCPVKLIISIDGGGPDGVRLIAEEFVWPHGPKEIITHQKNLGVRSHIISCGDLSRLYDGIIMLEDDLFVSPYFYEYTLAALEFYQQTPAICGVSLYAYRYNETAFFTFTPLHDGSDAYFMQLPCSWGQAWLKEHWEGFGAWYERNSATPLRDDASLPYNISDWPDTSWKKYFMKYMVEADRFFVYPRTSYSTNFGDAGQHQYGNNDYQVPLVCAHTGGYRFIEFDNCLVKYDVFCELLPDCLLNLSPFPLPSDLSVDLFGSKRMPNLSGEYVLTSKKCLSFRETFGKRLLPQEMNVINRIAGDNLFLARTDQLEEFGAVDQVLFGKASNVAEQRYYFGTSDVHYRPLRYTENRLRQAEENIRLITASGDIPQRLLDLDTSLRECQTRLGLMESSRSWQLTGPLRWFGNKLRGKQ